MSTETAGIVICVCLLGICILAIICNYEDRKARRGLPRPQVDERDWSGAFMRDMKDWSPRR